MNAVRGVCNGSLAIRQKGEERGRKNMKITKTINTATVTAATITVKDGKAETRTNDITLYSCDPLSDERIAKEVRRIDQKAVVVSVDRRTDKYAIDIEEFVKIAHVEQ